MTQAGTGCYGLDPTVKNRHPRSGSRATDLQGWVLYYAPSTGSAQLPCQVPAFSSSVVNAVGHSIGRTRSVKNYYKDRRITLADVSGMFGQLNWVRQLTQVSVPKRAPIGDVKDSERLTRLPKFSVDSELNYQRVTGFGKCHRSVKPSDTRVLQVPADVLRGTVSHATGRGTPALLSLATSQVACVKFSKLVMETGTGLLRSITTSLCSIGRTIPSSRPASGRAPRAAERARC